MLKGLSKKIGFTETELKVVLFLIFTFLAGFSYKTFIKNSTVQNQLNQFDYSDQDSIFLNSPGEGRIDSAGTNFKKEVDYKQEVLDFNNRSFKKYTKKTLPAEKSININTAGLEELITLPGIGQKTAESILKYRDKAGRFNKVDDLLKIKGIGKVKLNNIQKYIFIE